MASPQWDILTAVKTTLEGLAALAGCTVEIRERPFVSVEHGDSVPMVTVSPLKESVHSYYMPAGVIFEWPVIVAVFQSFDGVIQNAAQMQWRIARRWDIFQALGRPSLSGAATVFDFEYDPDPLVDLSGLDAHLKVSLQRFSYRSKETRGGAG